MTEAEKASQMYLEIYVRIDQFGGFTISLDIRTVNLVDCETVVLL